MDKLKQFVNTLNSKNKNTSSYGISKPPVSSQPIIGPQQSGGMSMVPTGNTSATSPKINTVTKSTLSPVAQKYIDTIPPAYDTKTGLLTDYGRSKGMAEVNKPKTDTTSDTAGTSTTQTTTPTAPVNPYQQYLDSFNKRQSAELLRNRKREDELRKNEIGQLERGQQYQLGEEERLSNRSLADLAIAKAPTLDLYNQFEERNKPIEVGGVLYKQGADGKYTALTEAKETLPASAQEYEYAKKQGYTGTFQQYQNEDANRKAKATGSSSYTGFSGTLSPLAQAVQNGTIALDRLPAADRSRIAAELASSGIQSGRQQALEANLSVVTDLLAEDTDAITGLGQNPFNVFGIANAKAQNLYNQLKGILSLENRQQLKGQGAISDFEFKVLQDASSALGRNLPNAEFRRQLEKIRDVFAGKYATTNATSAPQSTMSSGADPLGIR